MANVKQLRVNGQVRTVDIDESKPLLEALRENLDLTGTKYGCGEGQCGACTVHVDGVAKRSCLITVGEVADSAITTIEGLATHDHLHPLQQAFLDVEAMQCAYCTSGMIMSGASLLKRLPNPSDAEIDKAMEGNICRCGTHNRIRAAIRLAATSMKEVAR